MLRPLALTALLLTLCACASEPRRGHRSPPGEGFERGPGGPARVRLFLSPSGEPFRGENGLAAWFAGADSDHDGALSRAEFEADAMRFFKLLDANGDGKLDGFEIQAYEHERVPEIGLVDLVEGLQGPRGGFRGGGMGQRSGRGGHGGAQGGSAATPQPQAPGAGREGAARYSLLNEPEPVANADADVDGRVSLDEWKRATARRFDRLDKMKTGRLILSDLILPPSAKRPAPPPPPAASR